MATLQFNGHIYETALGSYAMWYWKRAQNVNDTPKPLVISHGTGCCNYWITDPDIVHRAVLDDTLTTRGIGETR